MTIVIPNTVLNNQSLVNSSIGNAEICAYVQVSVDYTADVKRAMEIMREETMKHPLLIDRRTEAEKEKGTPQVAVRMIEWKDTSICLRAWAWAASSGDAFVMKCDLLEAIKERFDKEKIESPLQYVKNV